MTRYIVKWPDGLKMLVGVDESTDEISMIGPMAPQPARLAWQMYNDPHERTRITHFDDLKELAALGTLTYKFFDPDFHKDFWPKYCGIMNQSDKSGTSGSGSKAKALAIWNKLSSEHKRKAYNYLDTYKRFLEVDQPTRPKLDAATYLNPKKADWNL